jgi:hypothetical protein
LTPASGRQNHTTSPSALVPLVCVAIRVHCIPHPTFVTTRTPLLSRRDVASRKFDLPDGESEIFLQRGLDSVFAKQPVGQITACDMLIEPRVAKAKGFATSALGKSRPQPTNDRCPFLPPTADIDQSNGDVRFVPSRHAQLSRSPRRPRRARLGALQYGDRLTARGMQPGKKYRSFGTNSTRSMRCLHHRGSPPPQNQINGALIPNWRNLNPTGIRAVVKHLTRRMIAGRGFAPRNILPIH